MLHRPRQMQSNHLHDWEPTGVFYVSCGRREDLRLKTDEGYASPRIVNDKRLGLLKYEMSQLEGVDLQNIKLFWKRSLVKVKGKKVFHINGNGKYVFIDEPAVVKDKVQTMEKQWIESRNGDGND